MGASRKENKIPGDDTSLSTWYIENIICCETGQSAKSVGDAKMDHMQNSSTRLWGRMTSVKMFAKRVIVTLTALVAISSVAVITLIYVPLKAELESSLINNFSQMSFIRYTSLQNNINRGLEGARSLSSRTVIRDAILSHESGTMSLAELSAFTQTKYEDGARALEYLLSAQRSVGTDVIASYATPAFSGHECPSWDHLKEDDALSYDVCLTHEHEYLLVRSPIVYQGRVIGVDRLSFDLGGQIHSLCTETVRSELIQRDAFESLISEATILKDNHALTLFRKGNIYYQAYRIQGDTRFVTIQSASSLFEPVYRLGRQVAAAGIGLLLIFALAVYIYIIRYANNELREGYSSLKDAVSKANTDPLTQAGSRRFGEELMNVTFSYFKNGSPSPALLLMDIDSLKQINDTHGHGAGDDVIRSVALAIQGSIRSDDVLIRWGGDEFVGIIYGLEKKYAMQFAEKLLLAVSSIEIQAEKGVLKPTISIGISYYMDSDHTFLDALTRADRAMFQSKAENKNKANIQ